MSNRLYKVLTMDDIPKILFEIGEKRKYEKNELLTNPTENYEGTNILLKGIVAVRTLSDKGQQIIRFVLKPPCLMGEIYTITGNKSHSYFEMLEDSEVLYISKQRLIDLIKTDDEVFRFIFDSLHKKMMIFITQTDEIIFLHADIKVAILLYEFAKEFGEDIDGNVKIKFNLTQQLICDLIGVNRSTVIRSINKLIEKNIICYAGRTFIVKDLEALRCYEDEYVE